MASDPTDVPVTEEPTIDPFGRPHGHSVSDSLHLWIIVPGILIILVVGEQLASMQWWSEYNRCTVYNLCIRV